MSMLHENEDAVFEDISLPRIIFWGEVCYQQRRIYWRYLFMSNFGGMSGTSDSLAWDELFPFS